jgi:hypothetical protein
MVIRATVGDLVFLTTVVPWLFGLAFLGVKPEGPLSREVGIGHIGDLVLYYGAAFLWLFVRCF